MTTPLTPTPPERAALMAWWKRDWTARQNYEGAEAQAFIAGRRSREAEITKIVDAAVAIAVADVRERAFSEGRQSALLEAVP